jgi:transposase InsO family protein
VSLYRLIEEESDRQPVSRLCRTLGVTRSGYYDWQRQPLSDRALADWLLSEQIRGIFEESEQTYGSPRIFKELKLGRGLAIGEKRVARLMRQAGLRSIHAKKRKGSTIRAKEHPLAPDLVGRDFTVDGPDRLWVADFTQLTTWQGTCYIAVVADAYKPTLPRLVGATRQDGGARPRSLGHGDLAARADAVRRRDPPQRPGLAVHLVRVHPPPRHRRAGREHGHRRRRARQRDVRELDRDDEDREAQNLSTEAGEA